MKKKIMISHGMVTHAMDECDDCIDCLTMQIEYLKAMRKAGGKKKFLKELKSKG